MAMDDPKGGLRHQIQVQLPCGSCVHQGVCLIEEQLEQDLTLRIGVQDAITGMISGGPRQPVVLKIDCSWFDARPVRKPREPMSPERRQAARERMLRTRPWEKSHANKPRLATRLAS